VLPPTRADALDARVLEAVSALVPSGGEHLLEGVVEAVLGREHEHVGHVVEEARPRPLVTHVAVANAAGEEMEHAVDDDQTGVEDRAVARGGAEVDHGRLAKTPRGDGECRIGHFLQPLYRSHRTNEASLEVL
jgi:hypothetical protein